MNNLSVAPIVRMAAWAAFGSCAAAVIISGGCQPESAGPGHSSAASEPAAAPSRSVSAPQASSFQIPLTADGAKAIQQGLSYFQAGQSRLAEMAFRRAVITDPASGMAHDYLGLAYLQQNRYSAAVEEFQREVKIGPAAYGWARIADVRRSQGDLPATIAALEKAAAADPNLAQVWFNLGALYPQEMQLKKALEALDRCVALQPANHQALYLRGNLLFKVGRLQDAENALDAAIRLSPKTGLYHFALAQVYLRHGSTPANTARAQSELKTALSLGVASPAEAHYWLGVSYERQQKWGEARTELETAQRLQPAVSATYLALHDAYLHLNQADLARRAEAQFQSLKASENASSLRQFYLQEAARNPRSPESYLQLARYLARTGELSQARPALEHARRLLSAKQGDAELRQQIASLSQQIALGVRPVHPNSTSR